MTTPYARAPQSSGLLDTDTKSDSDYVKPLSRPITIVIPAFNEAAAIGPVLERLTLTSRELVEEIIVVDDGSTDETRQIASMEGVQVISHARNRGYGASLKTGILKARTEFVLTMDSDGQHDALDISRLWEAAGSNDMVVGQRTALLHSQLWRMPGKWLLMLMANYLSRQRIPDLNSGFRLIRRDVVSRYLHLCPSGFSFSTTITMAFFNRGYKVAYVPIDVQKRVGKSTVSVSTGLETIILILRIATLFDPLRLFVPLSVLLGVHRAGLGDSIRRVWERRERRCHARYRHRRSDVQSRSALRSNLPTSTGAVRLVCGIAGYVNLNGAPAHTDDVIRMIRTLAHRGPDGEGVRICGPTGLGHRRLAIIDLSSAGRQPMSNEDGSVWVTFNGEIYNFIGIREELLALGHRFISRTDTEVIVHAYEEWGFDCLERFNGMFALALWDDKLQRLWLARDRLGVKPLFYARLPHRFLFGSEIKAILSDAEVGRALDYEALAYYLALNWMPAPHTLFANVRQLLPGHYLIIDANGRTQDIEYRDLKFTEGPSRRAEQDYVDEFDALLEDSIRLRLVSDVPFGSFLSGGLDSSAVSYYMSRLMSSPVKTFSIGFQERSFSELGYAEQVARTIASDHHERIVDANAAEILPKIVWHGEEPTADSSMVNVYYLAQMAREQVTMVLSGDGADECLAGYPTYQAYYLHRLYRFIPAALRNGIVAPLVNALPVSDNKVSFDFKLRRFVRASKFNSTDAHATWRMVFDADARAQLLSPVQDQSGVGADAIDLYRSWFAKTNAKSALNRMLYVDTRLYLPNDMLVKVDRMAMAHGLEAREPFLDYRLVEFLATVPPNLKLKQFRHKKYLLKRAMVGRLPDSVIWRKKEGFNLPKGQWMKSRLKEFVTDHLAPARIREIGLFDPAIVDQLLRDHFQGKVDNSFHIWCLLTLVLWWGQFIDGRESQPIDSPKQAMAL